MTDEEKQEEQYAAITAIGLVDKEYARLIRDGGDSAAIEQLILTKAQLSKDAFRLGAEVAGSKMSKNLIYFLDQAERDRKADAERILYALGELRGGQAALQAGFLAVGESVTQLQAEVAFVSAELGRSREHRAKLQAGQDELFKAILPIEERDRLIALLLDAERRLGIVEAEIEGLKAMQRQLDPGAPL